MVPCLCLHTAILKDRLRERHLLVHKSCYVGQFCVFYLALDHFWRIKYRHPLTAVSAFVFPLRCAVAHTPCRNPYGAEWCLLFTPRVGGGLVGLRTCVCIGVYEVYVDSTVLGPELGTPPHVTRQRCLDPFHLI